MQDTTGILITAAASTAAVHTLVPDHWLPFVLLGRTQKWSLLKAAWIAGLSSLVHVCISLALGALALGVGMGAARAMGERLHLLTGVLLCVFGVAYSAWAIVSGGHSHRHLHGRGHECSGFAPESDVSPEGWRASKNIGEAPETGQGPSGARGRAQQTPATHGDPWTLVHASPAGTGKTSAYSLMLIVGIHPCVLALPILFASAPLGSLGITLVAATYALCTIAAMVVVTLLALTAARQIRMDFLERHGDLLTGIIIFTVGVYILARG